MELNKANGSFDKKIRNPHVALIPFVTQSHRRTLLCLAQLLSHSGIQVTFVHTVQNHNCLANQIPKLSNDFPDIHFESISDGLPYDHPRILNLDYLFGMKNGAKPYLKELIMSLGQQKFPVTCIIGDGIMSFPFQIAQELEIPYICYLTTSAHFGSACLNSTKYNEECYISIPYDEMGHEVNSVPGLKELMQHKDIAYTNTENYPGLQFMIKEMHITTKASALILNTFEDLESQCLKRLVSQYYKKIYTIGPIHVLLNSIIGHNVSTLTAPNIVSSPNLKQDHEYCIAWLDSQALRSTIYVSFGTHVKFTPNQLQELWLGLIECEYPFLLVIRPDLIKNSNNNINDGNNSINFQKGKIGKGFIVDWALQEQVLNHKAVGGFFTHAGWNSILESIIAKVPMMFWRGSCIGDQDFNCLCMKYLWGIGIECETFDRLSIKEKIKMFMDSSGNDVIRSSVEKFAKSAFDAISEGGSSHSNFQELVEEIRNKL